MNLTEKTPLRKREAVRYKPCHEEGLYIQFLLKTKKHTFTLVGALLETSPQIVANVVFGQRRSSRIESKIAQILGKKSWNEVVLEARSEVQKKPVSVILQEMEQKTQVRRKEAGERMTSQIAQRRSELGWDQTAQKPKRRGA